MRISSTELRILEIRRIIIFCKEMIKQLKKARNSKFLKNECFKAEIRISIQMKHNNQSTYIHQKLSPPKWTYSVARHTKLSPLRWTL
jgi:hypothetical protein